MCSVCLQAISPGEAVHCNDGYDRIYGEFVLASPDGLHEDNLPQCHKRCSCPAPDVRRPIAARARVPRAVVVGGRAELLRLARARLLGVAVVAVAGGLAVWAGAGAGIGAFAAAIGIAVAASGIATRLRSDVAGRNGGARLLSCKASESVVHPDRRASC